MRVLALLLILLWPVTVLAQNDDSDRGFLVGLLENALGGEGRTVRIDGFAGALSSTATIDRITIADPEGIWLTLEDVAIGWNRSALFRAALDIQELRAARIELPRLPVATASEAPAPEATPFSLPDLPASLSIAQLDVDEVTLGETVLGEAVTLALQGSAELADGAGNVVLNATRTDGSRALFAVLAAFANDTRDLTLDLDLSEAEGGLISGMLNIPDRPSVDLEIAGDGPLTDFTATLDLRTNDAPRLAGTFAVQSEADGPMAFEVEMDGDVTALFLPQYGDFFGPDVSLTAQGNQASSGALTLDSFALATRALRLSGEAGLNADGWPTLLDISGEIAAPDGGPVLLPGSGAETRIDRATLSVSFDAEDGDTLRAAVNATGLDRVDLQADALELRFDGRLQGEVGAIGSVGGRLDVAGRGLQFADAAVARAVGRVVRGGLDVDYTEDAPLQLSELSLSGADWALTGDVEINSLSDAFETQFDTTVQAQDLSAFADLAGVALDGSGRIDIAGTAELGGLFDVTVQGTTQDLAIGVAQADALLAGQTTLDVAARRDTTGTFLDRLVLENGALTANATATLQTGASEALFNLALMDVGTVTDAVSGPLTVDGSATQSGDVWDIVAGLSGPLDATADATARVAPGRTGITLQASVPDLSPLVPQLRGGADITANAQQADGVWQFETRLAGPYRSTAEITGLYDTNRLTARYDIDVPELAPLAPGVPGGLTLDGDVRQTDTGWAFDTALGGPYATTGTVAGRFEDALLAASYDLTLPNVAAVAPGIPGAANVRGDVQQTARGWRVVSDLSGPYSSTGQVSATLTDGVAAARYALRLPNVSPLVPGVNGPLAVDGTAQQVAQGFDVDADISGPSGTTADISGRVASDGTLNMTARGQAPLGLANPFIEPRNVVGTANFDLSVNGPPALSSVTGQVTTSGTRLAAPNLPLSFSDISGAVRLSSGTATLDFDGGLTDGGAVRLRGPITLTGNLAAQIDVSIDQAVLSDPSLYTTTVNGQVSLRGPLAGGARIAGTIDVGETNVQVPTSGLSTFGSVPDITHIGATRPVMRTRDRAGLTEREAATSGGGAAFPLDITVRAPSRIFIRGRGIDAELGGTLRLTGTTADTISTGQFDLIRGRIDVLTKRFDLDEGRVQLQGRFEPFLRLVAETSTSTGTARIVVEGPADNPEVTFEATPDAPQDQILAQIFFGRDIGQLSAFQALQLASAVARLAGSGGEGIVSQLRGSFALDDLDVTSDEEGNTAVRAGKYISDNIYTDVTVGGAEGPEVSLNIDLTPNVTVRGTVGADSNTGIGVFIERDY